LSAVQNFAVNFICNGWPFAWHPAFERENPTQEQVAPSIFIFFEGHGQEKGRKSGNRKGQENMWEEPVLWRLL